MSSQKAQNVKRAVKLAFTENLPKNVFPRQIETFALILLQIKISASRVEVRV